MEAPQPVAPPPLETAAVPPPPVLPPAPSAAPQPPPVEIVPPKEVLPPKEAEAPKLVLPPSVPAPQFQSPEPLPKADLPAPPPPAVQEAAPLAKPEPAAAQSQGSDRQDLLALSPKPAPVESVIRVPSGEARGRFAISPEPGAGGADAAPGGKAGNSSAPGIGTGTASTSGGSGAGAGPGGAGTTAGGRAGPGGGQGSGRGGPFAGITILGGPGSSSSASPSAAPGRGGSGITILGGPGNSSNSTASSSSGALSGITVMGGGRPPSGPAKSPTPRSAHPLETSYGLTVVSTEASGGGLPTFGVFSNEQIYTVYLDMRRTETDPPESWTLEYALVEGSNSSRGPGGGTDSIVLPFPISREVPAMPQAVVRRHPHKMVIVFGIINSEGKLEQVSVKDSPDPQLNAPVIAALNRWVFRPAILNGKPAPAKVLMGIPLRF